MTQITGDLEKPQRTWIAVPLDGRTLTVWKLVR